MEASAILKMLEDAFYNHFFIIDDIVSDDDRTMQYLLKHPFKGVWCQIIKSSKGKPDEEIPDPSFLAYPSHHVKGVAKHIFSIVTKVELSDVGAPKQMLSESRNIGGTG